MDWIRPWLCKHVNRRCLPYVLSPRPAALSRAVLCRPQGADGGASEAWGPTVSVIHYLYANNHIERASAL
jgi:hypothetical protein